MGVVASSAAPNFLVTNIATDIFQVDNL